jgi:hypothetical protein
MAFSQEKATFSDDNKLSALQILAQFVAFDWQRFVK